MTVVKTRERIVIAITIFQVLALHRSDSPKWFPKGPTISVHPEDDVMLYTSDTIKSRAGSDFLSHDPILRSLPSDIDVERPDKRLIIMYLCTLYDYLEGSMAKVKSPLDIAPFLPMHTYIHQSIHAAFFPSSLPPFLPSSFLPPFFPFVSSFMRLSCVIPCFLPLFIHPVFNMAWSSLPFMWLRREGRIV